MKRFSWILIWFRLELPLIHASGRRMPVLSGTRNINRKFEILTRLAFQYRAVVFKNCSAIFCILFWGLNSWAELRIYLLYKINLCCSSNVEIRVFYVWLVFTLYSTLFHWHDGPHYGGGNSWPSAFRASPLPYEASMRWIWSQSEKRFLRHTTNVSSLTDGATEAFEKLYTFDSKPSSNNYNYM